MKPTFELEYLDFLRRKAAMERPVGMSKVPELSPVLFDFQRKCVELSLATGRFAQFLDTGLGKTLCQLEWARHVPGKCLILAPLAVAEQTRREAESKLGMEVHHSRDGSVKGKVTITNYERLHLFDTSQFNAIALDESSILKSFMGKTKRELCELFSNTAFRSCYTATPAPNDYMEIGNHSEFLGIMPGSEMLTRWFINDTMNFGHYRLKGHAIKPFWEWVASWAACVEKPSDAGGDDTMFNLPPLDVKLSYVETDYTQGAQEGELFRITEMSATSMHKEKRHSLKNRVDRVLELCDGPGAKLIWCETNDESSMIAEALGERCVEVTGSDSVDTKEDRLNAFSLGNVAVMVTKPSIAGFGLNWQHCSHQIFASLSYSYEQFYQAVRRSWRFGQKNPVRVDVVLARSETPLWNIVSRKMEAHRQMKDAMKFAKLSMATSHRVKLDYNPKHQATLPKWLTSKAA